MSTPKPKVAVNRTVSLDGSLSAPGDDPVVWRGQAVGRYVLVDKIGAGGMGVVYKAFDPELDRAVAIKLLRTNEASGRARTIREAQSLARLTHPNVVTVHDAGVDDADRVFVAMELIEGRTVAQWLADDEPEAEAVLDVFLRAGRGLAAAHAAGLVHRDFKPDNVMLANDGRVLVMDFGLARPTRDAKTPSVISPGDTGDPRVTKTGTLLGTPAYMSPEQFLSQPVGAASDQFAFAVSLYEALFGTRPFEGETSGAVASAVLLGQAREPPKEPTVAPEIRAAIMRGLSRQPDDRWPSLDALLAELMPTPRRRSWVAPAAVVAVVATAAAAYAVAGTDDPCDGGPAHWDATWNDERQRSMNAAFDSSRLPMVDELKPRVAAELDGFGERWIAAYREVCEATKVRREQSDELFDLRIACLHRARGGARALIELLEAADANAVEHSIESTRSLPSISRCADSETLRARQERPTDTDSLTALEELEVQLVTAGALRNTNEYERGHEVASALMQAATTVGYKPAEVAARIELGMAEGNLGRVNRSTELFVEAWAEAIEIADQELAFKAAAALVVSTANSPDEALRWARTGHALETRFNADPMQRASLLSAESAAARHGQAFEQAHVLLDRAEHALSEIDRWEWIPIAQGRVLIEEQRGDFEAGLHYSARWREAVLNQYPANHPEVARVDAHTAGILAKLGRSDEALAVSDRAVKICEESVGVDSVTMAWAYDSRGRVLASLRRPADAARAFALAHEIVSTRTGGGTPQESLILSNWGVALDYVGDHAASVEKHEAALSIAVAQDPPDRLQIAVLHDNLGSALQGLGRFEEALAHHRHAEPAWIELGPYHPSLGISLRDQARANIGLGRFEDAAKLLRRSLVIFEQAAVDPLEEADTALHLAKALWHDPGNREEALLLAQRVRTVATDVGSRGQTFIDDLQLWEARR